MIAMARNINRLGSIGEEDMGFFPGVQVKSSPVEEECLNGEDFGSRAILGFGLQVDDTSFLGLEFIISEVLAVGAVANNEMGF